MCMCSAAEAEVSALAMCASGERGREPATFEMWETLLEALQRDSYSRFGTGNQHVTRSLARGDKLCQHCFIAVSDF